MKPIGINLLRGGVFSLAVVAAFAFTQPTPEFQDYYAHDDGDWENVTSIVNSGQYTCPNSPGENCLYLSENLDDPRPGIEYSDRKFLPNP